MKIAVTGKGGVGKTFVAGTLSRLIRVLDRDVIAIDADPAMNLYLELEIDKQTISNVIPLSENQNLIQERTGITPYDGGPVFNLNPNVNDLIEKYAIDSPEGIRLLIMGTVKNAGKGCMCPANALLRALLRYVFAKVPATVIIDMEAGLEPLGRGTIQYVDAILNIIEPSVQSIETSLKILHLTSELGVTRHFFIANKVVNEEEKKFIEQSLSEHKQLLELTIPYDENVKLKAIRKKTDALSWKNSPAATAIMTLVNRLSS